MPYPPAARSVRRRAQVHPGQGSGAGAQVPGRRARATLEPRADAGGGDAALDEGQVRLLRALRQGRARAAARQEIHGLIAPALAVAYLGWRFYAGAQAIAGKNASPARIDLVPAQFEEAPRFARACDELRALGFTPIGDFEVRTIMGPNTRQRTVLRALLAPDRSAYAVVYHLASVPVLPNARAASRRRWPGLG